MPPRKAQPPVSARAKQTRSAAVASPLPAGLGQRYAVRPDPDGNGVDLYAPDAAGQE